MPGTVTVEGQSAGDRHRGGAEGQVPSPWRGRVPGTVTAEGPEECQGLSPWRGRVLGTVTVEDMSAKERHCGGAECRGPSLWRGRGPGTIS